MSFSDIVARGVAVIGGTALQIRRLTGGTPEPAWGNAPAIPAAKPQGAIPTLKMPTAKGWSPGQTPVAAPGLKVNAFATGLEHRRWIEVLPNGDVLVAESMQADRPPRSVFDYAMVSTMRRAAAVGVSANRITLLRDADGDGVAEDAARVPRGPEPALRHGAGRRHLLCRQHRRRRRLPLYGGRRPHHRSRPTPRRVQAGGPLDAQPAAEPRREEALCRRRLAHQHRRERHGGGGRPRRHLRARSCQRHAAASSPRACATPSAWRGSPAPARCGPWSTSATGWATRRRPTT